MPNRSEGIVAIVAAVLTVAAFGQVRSNDPMDAVHISGRMVDSDEAPLPDRMMTFRSITKSGSLQDQQIKTDAKGVFAFSAVRDAVYHVTLTVAEDALVSREIVTMQVVDAGDVAIGDIVLRFSPQHEPTVHLAGPIRIAEPPSPGTSATSSVQTAEATAVAAVYISCSDVPKEFCAGGTLHIIHGDRTEVVPPIANEQAGSRAAFISEDKGAVGWLVDYNNCCTSYPLSQKLMVYRRGKPVREFQGDGRAIFNWHFIGRMQVALYQDYPHGASAEHY
jgi:hypothetical protein